MNEETVTIQERDAVFLKLSRFMRENDVTLHDFFRADGNVANKFLLQLPSRERDVAKQVADDVYDML